MTFPLWEVKISSPLVTVVVARGQVLWAQQPCARRLDLDLLWLMVKQLLRHLELRRRAVLLHLMLRARMTGMITGRCVYLYSLTSLFLRFFVILLGLVTSNAFLDMNTDEIWCSVPGCFDSYTLLVQITKSLVG